MSDINYADLHKVYNPKQYDLQPEEEAKVEEVPEVKVVYLNTSVPNQVPVQEPIQQVQTVFHDPIRELVSDVLPFAVGFLAWDYLNSGKKTYVGNQHISDMSEARAENYRKRGLLD